MYYMKNQVEYRADGDNLKYQLQNSLGFFS